MSDSRRLSDVLRSALIFLPQDGSFERIEDGFVMLTPSNPGYWWGNSLHLDRPPHDGDFERWTRSFRTHVHARQPASVHMTFGWEGDQSGVVGPFVSAGFAYFETIGLTADRGATVRAPHPDRAVRPGPIAGDGWASLHALLVETRDPPHTEATYADFAASSIAGWRTLEARGQGRWFCVREAGTVVAALGVFCEAGRGPDGRRIGRFQHVVTHPSVRRRGLAGILVEHASRYAFAQLDVDTLLIAADENDVARRVYEACGFRIHTRHRSLERGGA